MGESAVEEPRPESKLYCTQCDGRVRWRKKKYKDGTFWGPPAKCSHCGVKAEPGWSSIWVRQED